MIISVGNSSQVKLQLELLLYISSPLGRKFGIFFPNMLLLSTQDESSPDCLRGDGGLVHLSDRRAELNSLGWLP